MSVFDPQIILDLFIDNYVGIQEQADGISHEASIQPSPVGDNTIYWIVGHLVVARCNFLMLLGVPSIWEFSQCQPFIPGSVHSLEPAEDIDFGSLLDDLGRTQELLVSALKACKEADLGLVRNGKSIGQELLEYARHEAFHIGQLSMISRPEH